jgi:MEMO1 family protein
LQRREPDVLACLLFSLPQGGCIPHLTFRQPAVAGRFYPRDRDTLIRDLGSYLKHGLGSSADENAPTTALGCVVPHAGYLYSGAVAGAVFARMKVPQCCIVLGPNHTGKGHPLAIMSDGAWQTPLGSLPIDSALANALKQEFPLLIEDSDAHRSEHAIEVELPFLQTCRADCTFVPITLGTRQFDILGKLGEALAEVIRKQNYNVLIIASSDMNHYENDAITRAKDHQAIERMLALDPRGLFDTVHREQVSMCGLGPAVVMLTAARHMGATSAELVKYSTSGDVSGDRDRVVGYAGLIVR